MTDEMKTLSGLLEESPEADVLSEMIGFAVQWSMELGVGGLIGAGLGEEPGAPRSAQRLSRA